MLIDNKWQKEKYNIWNTEYQANFIGLLKFEFYSWLGRIFFNTKPSLQLNNKRMLNLGCGKTKFSNWTNADFFSLKFWGNKNYKPDWMLDLRYPLNCDSNFWDGVFTEHTLEHLYPNQVMQLLKELNRTMKPGAWLRVSVPDLKKYVSYYSGGEVDQTFHRWQTGCEAIRTLTQDYIHVSLWDSELLSIFLKESGFINIREVAFMQGTDESLLKDKKERAWESLYMEAQKPIEN
jgi:predicted SAM-dependent methyltransferase